MCIYTNTKRVKPHDSTWAEGGWGGEVIKEDSYLHNFVHVPSRYATVPRAYTERTIFMYHRRRGDVRPEHCQIFPF